MSKFVDWLSIRPSVSGVTQTAVGALCVAAMTGAMAKAYVDAQPETAEARGNQVVAVSDRPEIENGPALRLAANIKAAPEAGDEESLASENGETEATTVANPAALANEDTQYVAQLPDVLPMPVPVKLRAQMQIEGRFQRVFVANSDFDRQRQCLATGLYFEARGETYEGQLAVAEVVLNRVQSKYYPNSICGVVYQGANRSSGCQFSFACDGVSDIPRNKKAWSRAYAAATKVLNGYSRATLVGGATYYHADYVRPRWAREMTPVAKIGKHIFYEHVTSPRRS